MVNVSFASAAFSPRNLVEDVTDNFAEVGEPVLQAVLGGVDYTGELLFEKLLFFVLFVSLVYLSLNRMDLFGSNKGVIWTISIVVPLLGVRFLSYEWLNAILLQYQVLGIALVSILPFIIYFFFLHSIDDASGAVRKVGWIFFIVLYTGLWASSESSLYISVYLWTIVASLVFLFFDKTIHNYYAKNQLRKQGSTNKWQHIGELRKQIREMTAAIAKGDVPPKQGQKIIKKLQKQVEWAVKNM